MLRICLWVTDLYLRKIGPEDLKTSIFEVRLVCDTNKIETKIDQSIPRNIQNLFINDWFVVAQNWT